ncbi:Phytanoyl-CoA dioxygenase family protein [Aspergillus sclerotialis]|uniref:Phytanoyl-CoA dioxygenase family protein n=1 Tax=Aspergillus sclerotialis TaxID=2070753 RepID=A0A3A2ZPU2_9EURO|nr:Phytanoyl-CoA dioxygenase family protein [Aspergillus sclerotialis]
MLSLALRTRTLSFKSKTQFTRTLSGQPTCITPSKPELQSGRLTPQNLEVAIRSLYNDGLVVVNDVIPHSHLDRLNEKMVQDAYTLQARKEDSPFNYHPNNLQQDPPPMREYFESDIFLNPIAIQITTTALGPRPKWTFCSGNTAMPPTPTCPPLSQPVHSDADFDHPLHPFAHVINVPLITMTPENGSTEVWLGSHTETSLSVQEGRHGERASGRIRGEELEKRRKVRTPCQPIVEKGAIVVRDLRLWHAGVGNRTNDIRVMLAMIHFAPWYRNPMKLNLADDLKPVLEENTDLEIPVQWASRDEVAAQYLKRAYGNAYDFSQSL